MAGFNLADYQTVEERNSQFWAKYPNGRIVTDVLFQDGSRYICRSEVFRDAGDAQPAATGHAEEHVTGSGVNKTSALENCETSAEGRALARLGFATKGARPSREEMEKVERRNGQNEATVARARLAKACKEHGWAMPKVGARWAAEHKISLGEATDAAAIDKFRESLSGVPQAELVGAS